jgi:diketogulonate reductase-like aldo/keto reductase
MTNSSRFQGVPDIIYGTAFKFDQTSSLVEAALKAGFRAIDTAGNKPQYEESLVGKGIATVINSGTLKRNELYVCVLIRILWFGTYCSSIRLELYDRKANHM